MDYSFRRFLGDSPRSRAERLMAFVFDTAKKAIEAGESWLPVVLLLRGDRIAVVETPWTSRRQCEVMLQAVERVIADDLEIDTYALCAESMTVACPDGSKLPAVIDPDGKDDGLIRTTSISIEAKEYGRDGFYMVAPITRTEGGERRVGSPERFSESDMDGPMMDLFSARYPAKAVH